MKATQPDKGVLRLKEALRPLESQYAYQLAGNQGLDRRNIQVPWNSIQAANTNGGGESQGDIVLSQDRQGTGCLPARSPVTPRLRRCSGRRASQ